MNPATTAQISAIDTQAARAFNRFSSATDVILMARKMSISITALDQLSRAQATRILNRLDELNNPARTYPRSWMPR